MKFAPAIESLAVPVDSVVPDAANVRTHGEKNLAAIKASLQRFGQTKPIVVRKAGRVVLAGNGTLAAAKALGWEKIAVVEVDVSDAEGMALAIADNRTAELAEWDQEALLATLRQIEETVPAAALGFSADDLTRLLAAVSPAVVVSDPSGEWAGMPDYSHEDKTPVRSILVHFAAHEHVVEFASRIGQTLTEKTKSVWFPRADIERMTDKRYVSDG